MFNNIKITRGMFNMINDEAELVCLLGHEIWHSILIEQEEKDTKIISKKNKKKTNKELNKVSSSLLKSSKIKDISTDTTNKILKSIWSQEEEEAADRYGADLAYKAGYDPYAFCDLFERLSARIDLDFIYRIGKLEGSHSTLNKRVKSLRKYLQNKGYKEGVGKRNRENFINSMADLYALNPKSPDNLTKQIDKQSKKDIKQLDKIIKELNKRTTKKETITVDQFFKIIETISQISKKYNITKQDILGANISKISQKEVASFMEEKIVQETPFWEIFDELKEIICVKIRDILNMLAHIGVGVIPIVGDSIDLYEFLSGKDAFTQETLTVQERMLTAIGILIGTGAMWRNFAGSISTQATKSGLKDVDNIVNTIKKEYSSTIDSKVAKGTKRSISKELTKTIKNFEAPVLKSAKQREVYNSFAGGKFKIIKYDEGTKLYRIADKKGNYWSLNPPPKTEYQWRVDNAIKQEFSNSASKLYIITIPKNSTVSGLTGKVGSQGMGLYGGNNQSLHKY